MKKCIAMLFVVTLLAGCGNKSVAESKKEAYERWYNTRAKVMYGLAEEQYTAGNLDEARKQASDAIGLCEEFTHARILLGKIFIEQGHFGLASKELVRALEEMPRNSELLYLLGVSQEKQGMIDEALVNYRLAQAVDNTNIAAVMAATEVLASDGRIRQAQLYIESYMELAGSEAGMYEIAGRLAMMQKQYSRAAEYYQKAADLAGDNVHYAESLAKAQFQIGQYRQAGDTLIKLIRTEEYEATAWAYALLGDCHMQRTQFEKARRCYLQTTRLAPEDAQAWASLSKSSLALDELPRSIVSARRAIELDDRNADAKLLLGYALVRDGQITAALDSLTSAVQAHSDNAEMHCVLGRAYEQAGNAPAAAECYQQAVRIAPQNVLARELAAQSGSKTISAKID